MLILKSKTNRLQTGLNLDYRYKTLDLEQYLQQALLEQAPKNDSLKGQYLQLKSGAIAVVQNDTRWKCASCENFNEIELCKRIDLELV